VVDGPNVRRHQLVFVFIQIINLCSLWWLRR